MKSKLKNKKKLIIAFVVLLLVLILLIFGIKVLFFHGSDNVYGDRCSDRDDYKISEETIDKVEEKIQEISEVNDIEIYTKLCTVKIIINLDSDVELDVIKDNAREVLSLFSEDELSYYDFALFVTSDNEESEIYPINVSKHNSRDDFAW